MFVEKVKELEAELNTARQKMKEQMAKVFQEAVKDIFLLVPGLKAVYWTQYTPYFNDGEACIFSVNEVFFYCPESDTSLSDVIEEEGYIEDIDGVFCSWDFKDAEFYEVLKVFQALLSQSEDYLRDTFGDGVQVILYPDSVVVNEYEHD